MKFIVILILSFCFLSPALAGERIRYIRFDGYYSSDRGQINLYEIEAYDAAGVNRARSATVVSNSGVFFETDRLVDGLTGTFRFSTDRNTPGLPSQNSPHRIEMVLAEAVDIELIRVFQEPEWSISYQMFVSIDGIFWKSIGSVEQKTDASPKAFVVGPPSQAVFQDPLLIDVDLSGADLSGADLRNILLIDSNLRDVDLFNANLSGADLTGIQRDTLDLFNQNEIQQLQQENLTLAEADAQFASELVTLKSQISQLMSSVQELTTTNASLQASLQEKELTIEQQAAQIQSLSLRPTMAQVQDARLGSVLVEADPVTKEVSLVLDVEESDDLNQWQPSGVKARATIPLGPDKKFYRLGVE